VSLLGIDIGTSGCKAIVVAADGRILASSARPYVPVVPEPGNLELDPEVVWSAVCATAREVAALTTLDPPVAMAIAALGEAFLILDAEGRPISPIILSGDQRGSQSTAAFIELLGAGRIRALTGLAPERHYSAPKIKWWLMHGAHPEGSRIALVQDFIAGRLGVPPATDPSLATRTMLLDASSRAWSAELLAAVPIGIDQLPRVVDAGTVIGLIDRSGRAALGLRGECTYVVGGLDAACVALGVGVTQPGGCVLALGTNAAIGAVLDADSESGGVPAGPHVVPGRRLAIGAAQAGGAALRWYRDLLEGPEHGTSSIARLTIEMLLAEVRDRPSSVVFVAHLAGSRFAFGDPNLSAAFAGLSLAVDRPEVTRAILEGVALELAVVCEKFEDEGLRIPGIIAAGGGTRSRPWVQIISDVLDRPIASTGSGAAGALGAALLAGVGAGTFASFEAAATAQLAVLDAFEPRQKNVAWWTRRRADYRGLVGALSGALADRGPQRPTAA
jgi:xylulokinase